MEVALTTFLANNHVLDQITDREQDSQEEIRLKKSIGAILAKPPDQRQKDETKRMGDFFKRFKFFGELREGHEADTYHGVMQYLNFINVRASHNIIEHGEEGDRFYVIIKGVVDVRISVALPTGADPRARIEDRIMSYL